MTLRQTLVLIVLLVAAFIYGFKVSYVGGIQPGYFEKAEAPAYGVGGGEGLGVELDKEVEKHFKNLYKDNK